MIDTDDKATPPLPLDEQPMKRKRGRPSTGKAMTPAEKQRAYRERQKKLSDQKADAEQEKAYAGMWEKRYEHASRKVEDLLKDLALKETQLNHWIQRAEAAEKELESRDQKSDSNVWKDWVIEARKKGTRKWKRTADNKYTLEDAVKEAEMAMKRHPEYEYRAREV
ncbi:hypothetical protein ACWKWZ_07145 [Metapseudomonas otitidis]